MGKFFSYERQRNEGLAMKKDELASLKEAAYIQGQQAVWRSLIQQGLSKLEGNEYTRSELLLERAEAINALKTLCEEFNLPIAWDDSLHLADIIEKHIYRSLRNIG